MSRFDSFFEATGLALAVACGVIYLVERRRRAAKNKRQAPHRTPHVTAPSPEPLCLALALYAKDARERAFTIEESASLLPLSAFWWTGPLHQWGERIQAISATQVDTIPGDYHDVVLIGYELHEPTSPPPTSRPEAAAHLRDALRRNALRPAGLYTIASDSRLANANFRR